MLRHYRESILSIAIKLMILASLILWHAHANTDDFSYSLAFVIMALFLYFSSILSMFFSHPVFSTILMIFLCIILTPLITVAIIAVIFSYIAYGASWGLYEYQN